MWIRAWSRSASWRTAWQSRSSGTFGGIKPGEDYGKRVYQSDAGKPGRGAPVLHHPQQEAPSGGGGQAPLACRAAGGGACLPKAGREGGGICGVCPAGDRLGPRDGGQLPVLVTIEKELNIDCFSTLADYKALSKPELMYNKNVSLKVQELSKKLEETKNEQEFFDVVTQFYKDYGVGMFGLNKAFRIATSHENYVELKPINNMDEVILDDLVGYEIQKKKLLDNTVAFVEGRKANNVLLYGDSGTGKSTSIKAIVNEFYDQGLRMIEIYKHQFKDLSNIIAMIKNRNYRFIIYMDDLSFEEFEIEYKFLKAVIEGGVETKPENILIYATSNRRHLIKENWSDRNDVVQENGMHQSDTMEEKLSLVNRFGVKINYSKPMKKEFNHIVLELAHKNNIEMDEKELLLEANKWELSHGGTSGRTAQQFINYILGLER